MAGGRGSVRVLSAVWACGVAVTAQAVLRTNQAPAEPATNLLACGFHPYLAPGLTLSGAVSEAAVVVTNGPGTDAVRVDPDPTQACSYGAPNGDGVLGGPSTCGPCPPLVVSDPQNATRLTITGAAPASVYESCLRRVFIGSTAYGGDEGVGTRVVSCRSRLAPRVGLRRPTLRR